eukprot:NODE_7679_length_426_cov_266.444744.p1 GENE.NODE_7679_length_426_cov_266.444744~~NODE_7679_length_426_cov_266.444744.p1  ORF type:complete len:89 (+),score=39.16 NODE_7679_length_426_cov_266.444744:3-269(+)
MGTKAQKQEEIERRTEKKDDQGQMLTVDKSDLAGTEKELSLALAYYEKLKPSCIDSGVSYSDRAARRQDEIESLQDALRILSDGDIAF